MNQTQYRQFLNDPANFLNNDPKIRRIRISISADGPGFHNNVQSTDQFDGTPIFFQFSDALVKKVNLRYDGDTVVPQNRVMWAEDRVGGAEYVSDRAYYLDWDINQSYAIKLGYEAQLFFTAQLDGCGILVFETSRNLIIVHHNIQVAMVGKNRLQKAFEPRQAFINRDRANRFDVRARKLDALSDYILTQNEDIIGGTSLNVRQYLTAGKAASVFGVKRSGRWRIYVNHNNDGASYRTDLLYG